MCVCVCELFFSNPYDLRLSDSVFSDFTNKYNAEVNALAWNLCRVQNLQEHGYTRQCSQLHMQCVGRISPRKNTAKFA